jgi:CubicO group peptidase (beta-lactamase class C family)
MIKSIFTFFASVLLTVTSWAQENEIPKVQPLTYDTPSTTVLGNPFIAPADWFMSIRGPATFIDAPEGGSRIVLVDVQAKDADAALAKGWAAYKEIAWPLKVTTSQADRDGWSRRRRFEYQTSPNEKRTVIAGVMFANNVWTVWIYDMAHDVGGKRSAQVNLVFSSLLPKGYSRETFAGKKPNELDETRIAQLTTYIENAIKTTGVPGVGLGIIQNSNIVFAGGFGVRELGKREKVDEETLFIIASNTKAMTTLLLARLVDAGKLTWTTPVTDLMSTFRLGSDETTKRTLVEHLICACTGLPRKDMEFIFEFGGMTPVNAMQRLAETEPTSDFGEMYQYSNGLAATAGYVAGHVLFPELEIGEAYDKAMQTEVFDTLDMKATTFDFERALAGNYASAHGTTVDGESGLVDMGINYSVIHVRPAGAAWSNVNDMLKYIEMELNEGILPDGKRYISSEALLERRVAKVPTSQNAVYGMGLEVDETYGTPVVHHGGDVFGHHSDMMWLPEHGIGAVVLTNGDPGWLIRDGFRRKLLEVLFNGKPEADEALASNSKRYFERIAADRKLYTVPADPIAA